MFQITSRLISYLTVATKVIPCFIDAPSLTLLMIGLTQACSNSCQCFFSLRTRITNVATELFVVEPDLPTESLSQRRGGVFCCSKCWQDLTRALDIDKRQLEELRIRPIHRCDSEEFILALLGVSLSHAVTYFWDEDVFRGHNFCLAEDVAFEVLFSVDFDVFWQWWKLCRFVEHLGQISIFSFISFSHICKVLFDSSHAAAKY